MKVLITGANGQLGRSIKKHAPAFPTLEFVFTDVGDLDITNMTELEKYFASGNFDYVINCAGYTAVDKAEQDKEKAFLINTKAVEYLADISAKHNAGLIHISTDFVFDGKKSRPYTEADETGPLSVYSTTKAEAEKMLDRKPGRTMIVRTSWLYSEFGHNFVKTILKHAREKDELRVVFDQTGTPTYGGDLAEVLLLLISKDLIPDNKCIYHYSNQGIASWYDFAKAIIDIAGIRCRILPVSTEEYPLPARRPFYSVMSKARFIEDFGIEIPYWRDSLKICIELLDRKADIIT